MADNNKLELVVEVGVNKANASIKSINTGLSSMEQAAGKAARGASAGIDGFTVSMVKGATAGNLLFKGKLKPDDGKKMGYTDDQVREIISGKKLLPGESWGDFSGAGFPKIKILGKGELSDDEVNRIATERKKRGEAEKSAQELYMRAVEERKSAEHDQARARIEDSMKIIESTHSETEAARESLNVVLLSMEERQAGIEKIKEEE